MANNFSYQIPTNIGKAFIDIICYSFTVIRKLQKFRRMLRRNLLITGTISSQIACEWILAITNSLSSYNHFRFLSNELQTETENYLLYVVKSRRLLGLHLTLQCTASRMLIYRPEVIHGFKNFVFLLYFTRVFLFITALIVLITLSVARFVSAINLHNLKLNCI